VVSRVVGKTDTFNRCEDLLSLDTRQVVVAIRSPPVSHIQSEGGRKRVSAC